MDSTASAAVSSWALRPGLLLLLAALALLYARGWRKLRPVLPERFTSGRLTAFNAGLFLLYIALASPLDAFSSLLLSAHMVQHLLLMMVVPPLLLGAQPVLPLLRGLPRAWVKHGLAPYLRWPLLRRVEHVLTAPVFCWAAFNLMAVGWHVPFFYELALHSPGWHEAEHALFFWSAAAFWWPVVQPWPSRARWPGWTVIPYLLLADLVNTAISATFVFSEKVLYPTYDAQPLGAVSPRADQTVAGLIMWVPGSLFYLVPAVVLASRLLGGPRRETRRMVTAPSRRLAMAAAQRQFDVLNAPGLGRFLRWRYARPAMQAVLFTAALAVIVDGFTGPRMAPMNLAGVLPWVHWRAALIIGLLAAGNLFCMACPFMLVRSVARKLVPVKRLPWPAVLRTKWFAVALVAAYFWAYEAFDLWNSTQATAWIVAGYFAAALAVDSVFRDAAFCKYVCPIGQFNFVASLVSPFEVKVREEATCRRCATFDCIKGNTQTKGCELHLFQPKKISNLDCTFCLDCVHACPHENVGILRVAPGATVRDNRYRSSLGRLAKRYDYAALAAVITFGAWVNAFAMAAPFARWTESLWAIVPRPWGLATIFLVLLGVVPAAALAGCAALGRAKPPAVDPPLEAAAAFTFTLVPLGAAMWAAHYLFHFSAGALALLPVAIRTAGSWFAGGGEPDWNLASTPLAAHSIAPLQIILLDGGLLLTLYLAWRLAQMRAGAAQRGAIAMFLPWGVLAAALYAAGIVILLAPMQMRGTMMMH